MSRALIIGAGGVAGVVIHTSAVRTARYLLISVSPAEQSQSAINSRRSFRIRQRQISQLHR